MHIDYEERIKELESELGTRTAELKQRTEELGVLYSVQEALVSSLDIQSIYDLVGQRIRELFDAQAVVIRDLDPQTKTEYIRFAEEKGKRFFFEPVPADDFSQYLMTLRERFGLEEFRPGQEEAITAFESGRDAWRPTTLPASMARVTPRSACTVSEPSM